MRLTRSARGVALAAVTAAVLLSGCSGGEEAAADDYYPSHVEEIPNSEVKHVSITDDAAGRIGLETAEVVQAGDLVSAPYEALLYDGTGKPWLYVVEKPLEFVRHAIAIDRIEGDRVLISEGVRAGDQVATVGSTEIYGTELGIDGSH
ncbi:MAG TPA: hypothetical protein VFV76_10230 [Actinomycetes bacterium]|nr:hypothetical protein [Actinomycetes bacterium]